MSGAVRYLCLAAKAGALVTGAEPCRQAAQRGRAGLLVLASDAADSARALAGTLAARPRLRLMETAYTKSELGGAVGRGRPVALAMVTNRNLAAAFMAAAAKEQEEDLR